MIDDLNNAGGMLDDLNGMHDDLADVSRDTTGENVGKIAGTALEALTDPANLTTRQRLALNLLPPAGNLMTHGAPPSGGLDEIRARIDAEPPAAADPNEPSWGDVGTSALKVLLGQNDYTQTSLGKPGLTPKEEKAYWGTIMPATAAGVGILAGGPGAGLAAREALSLGTGAAARAASAYGRGDDVTGAVLSPSGVAIDATMAALPEIWQGTKYVGRQFLPSAVQADLRAAGSAISNTAGNVVRGVANRVASRYPGFGEKLVDDTGVTLPDLFDRPPLPEPDYASLAGKMEPGIPAPTGRTGLQAANEAVWNGSIRALRQSDNPLAQTAGDMIDRANNIQRSITNSVRPKLQGALDAIPPEASANVVGALETGIGTNVDEGTAELARPLRSILRDINDMRQGQGVWDEVNKTRALELLDQGIPVQTIGESHQFAPAQTTQFFFPHRPVPNPQTAELTGLERIIANNPELSVAQAERRLGGLMSSGAIGHTRTAEEAAYSTSVHDVLPGYLDDEAKRIANAAVFGGKPTKVRIEVGGGGGRDIVVGDKGAAIYRHLFATGQYDEARQFLAGLEARYSPASSAGMGWARGLSRATSDMALSHSWATQIGQSGTGMALAGGPQQAARGLAMVDANPVLRDIFAAGPQSNQITDYIAMGRGGEEVGAATPMQAMHGIENWLRGPASYAAVPMIYDTAHEAKALVDAGQPFTGAVVKKAAEMGTTPQFLADELAKNGTLSTGTWLNSIQSLANRWQHTAGPGDLPNFLRTPAGALLGQYKTFGIKQSQLMMDDVIKPMFDSDPTLRALGLKRAALMLTTNTPLNAANIAVRSVVSGRAPTARALLRGAITGPTGIAGDAAYALGSSVAPKYGDDPMSQFSEIPSVAIPLGAVHDVMGSYYQPGRGAAGALRLAGAIDPRIPMYGAAPLGLARELMSK